MSKIMRTASILSLFCLITTIVPSAGFAGNPEKDIKVVKISGKDQSAVVQLAGRPMKVVHQGDLIKPYGEIVSIVEERIVLKTKNAETLIINFKSGKQTFQRIGKMSTAAKQPRVGVSVTSGQQKGRQHSGTAKASPDKP